ncbi:lipid-A-disaccharide synthase [Glaciecola siphonariae]|uniref:Lipid-A-disaccharide synthase n=1 Tax=Glaciecola siphonariae TaxID=521012 RepID=A0ABV9LU23_9ALTE
MADIRPLRIGIVAGEASGDVLGAGLIKSLKSLHPNCEIVGIGGQHLIEQGIDSLVDINELSVMGLLEVVKHLPRLLRIRKMVIDYFTDNPPDVFIGVDAPDFNLPVAKKLKARGIKTVHYVSPTVWAWREGRIHKIAAATNLVLGIFPFEQPIYDKYSVPYQYVGHTLADSIPLKVDRESARANLSISTDAHVLAILPGSRAKEIASMLPVFLQTADLYKQHVDGLHVVIPAANQARLQQIEALLDELKPAVKILLSSEPARTLMIAADAVLLTSGTASLEAMLCKRPMVVAYRMSALTYIIMQRLYKPDYFALPNILAEQALVPELLQEQVNPENLCHHLLEQLERDQDLLMHAYREQHKSLQQNADEQAAKAVLVLINADEA